MLKIVVVCAFLATAVLGAQQRYPPADPANIPAEYAGRKGCYVEARQLFLELGASYPDVGTRCNVFNCRDSGEIIEDTCGALAIQNGCRRQPGNLNERYPDCCDSEVC